MKLVRLNLINGGQRTTKRYKSLQPFNQHFTLPVNQIGEVNPIALVGINGSGKSNLLEFIAEIFFYLESTFLVYVPKIYQKRFNIEFEIEYLINFQDEEKHIKIIKHKSKPVEFFFIGNENTEEEIIDIKTQKAVLPLRIVGYSSGLNETLSIPFKTLRSLYADEVGIQANPKSLNKIDASEVVPPRLMYMDNETNEMILISNFLLKSVEKLNIFKELLRIDSLHSFRIIIQLNHTAAPKGGILITEELEEYISKLVNCSTTYIYDPELKKWILDFYNCKATKDAVEHHFLTAQKLFEALYKLSLLNPLCVKGRENRKWAISNDIFPPDKAFRIENLYLNIDLPKDTINYKGISDGEHQFIHVVGSSMLFDEKNILYLFDEPETHFNPKWRAKFITSLEKVLEHKGQELMVTTHSPFILSDIRGYNVFVFKRDGAKVWFEPIGFETFGTSFQILLQKAFDRDVMISELALEEIKDLIKNETDVSVLIEGANKLGDSFEKQFLLEKINSKLSENK